MNAFLIFCKRHRGSVRSGFPHLENRAVTRVLGEWWATLHPDQKRSYTNLAQEVSEKRTNELVAIGSDGNNSAKRFRDVALGDVKISARERRMNA